MPRAATPSRSLPILLALLLSAAVPLAAMEPAATPRELSDADWRADLDQVVQRIESEHFQPFRKVSQAELHRAAESLRADVPDLSDVEIMLRLAELVALVGDGHTRLALPRLDPELAMPLEAGHGGTEPPRIDSLRLAHLPVAFDLFEDGLWVVRATHDLERLVGARVESFDTAAGAVPADEAVERTRPLAFADNDQGVRWYAPDRLALPAVLAHLGLSDDPGSATLTLMLRDGRRERMTLAAVAPGAAWTSLGGFEREPLWLRRRAEARWSEMLADRSTLYVQLNELEGAPTVPTSDWFRRVTAAGTAAGAERLVLDLRHDFGGSGSWNRAIVRALAESPYDEYGRLYVLTGRRTFSAAQTLVQALEVGTFALFVGEPTGSRPGHFGDPKKGQLDHSGLTLRVSKLYWSPELGGDFRTAVEPHLPATMAGADFFAARDPALETAMSYRAPAGVAAQVEDLLRRGRTQEAVIHLYRFLADPRPDHDVADSLASAGGRLLDDGLVQEATYAFALGREYFPRSAAIQAGQGRLDETRGKVDEALAAYRRALELDPDNAAARAGVERLEGGARRR